jgi:hypothetical protein
LFWWWKKSDSESDVRDADACVDEDGKTDDSVIVVSGLPRSGTSLMMQMLEAGGIEPLTDGVRSSDRDNPRGYYELERVKQLSEGDAAWVEDARGKAVKVVSALIQHLPAKFDYHVIFMNRRIQEVLASQEKMLERRDEEKRQDDEEMARIFRSHLTEIRQWLEDQPNVQCLFVDFNELVLNPEPVVQEVNQFLAAELDAEKMAQVVDPELYRNRVQNCALA